MRRQTTPGTVTQFAGLTTHNNADMTERAANIAGIDADDPPETSLATAIRDLEQASRGPLAWKLPDEVSDHINVDGFNEETDDGTEMFRDEDGRLWVQTSRFNSVVSENKIEEYTRDEFTDQDGSFQDALFHVPSHNYQIINATEAYETLEQGIRDEGLGDDVFGTVREYKSGGEVHMDLLFDAYQIDYNDDDQGTDPIVLGIRTGYDFFGDTTLYFEGFAQDTRCSNSIRAITDRKVVKHSGDDLEDRIEEASESVLEELGVMTDHLADLIEMAQDIELELLDMDFADPFDHDDNLRAFYELSGFPTYVARDAANHARTRADNRFMPDMTDVWDGATYALTHTFNGGENTSTARDYIQTANEYIQNPSLAISRVREDHTRRLAEQREATDDESDLSGEGAHASIANLEESVSDLKDEFESRNEELRNSLVAEVEESA